MSLSLFFCFGKSFTVGVAVKKSHVLKKRGVERGRSKYRRSYLCYGFEAKLSLSHFFESLPRRATASS